MHFIINKIRCDRISFTCENLHKKRLDQITFIWYQKGKRVKNQDCWKIPFVCIDFLVLTGAEFEFDVHFSLSSTTSPRPFIHVVSTSIWYNIGTFYNQQDSPVKFRSHVKVHFVEKIKQNFPHFEFGRAGGRVENQNHPKNTLPSCISISWFSRVWNSNPMSIFLYIQLHPLLL